MEQINTIIPQYIFILLLLCTIVWLHQQNHLPSCSALCRPFLVWAVDYLSFGILITALRRYKFSFYIIRLDVPQSVVCDCTFISHFGLWLLLLLLTYQICMYVYWHLLESDKNAYSYPFWVHFVVFTHHIAINLNNCCLIFETPEYEIYYGLIEYKYSINKIKFYGRVESQNFFNIKDDVVNVRVFEWWSHWVQS